MYLIEEDLISLLNKEPLFLGCLSNEEQDNESLVMAAVRSDGTSLMYASERLQANKIVAITAIKNDFYAINHIHSSLKRNKDFLKLFFEHIQSTKFLSSSISKTDFFQIMVDDLSFELKKDILDLQVKRLFLSFKPLCLGI